MKYIIIISNNKIRRWWYNKNYYPHRVDGPAFEHSCGDRYWYQNGKAHRVDGPALEYANGSKCWAIEGEEITKEEFYEIQNKNK